MRPTNEIVEHIQKMLEEANTAGRPTDEVQLALMTNLITVMLDIRQTLFYISDQLPPPPEGSQNAEEPANSNPN